VLALASATRTSACSHQCGGVLALRALDGALEVEGSRRVLAADWWLGEARITPDNCPPNFSKTIHASDLWRRPEPAVLADEMGIGLEPLGLRSSWSPATASGESGCNCSRTPMFASVSLAAAELAGRQRNSSSFLPGSDPATAGDAYSRALPDRGIGRSRGSGHRRAARFHPTRQLPVASRWNGMAMRIRDLEACNKRPQYRPGTTTVCAASRSCGNSVGLPEKRGRRRANRRKSAT